jgi:hypothetical protein
VLSDCYSVQIVFSYYNILTRSKICHELEGCFCPQNKAYVQGSDNASLHIFEIEQTDPRWKYKIFEIEQTDTRSYLCCAVCAISSRGRRVVLH